MILNPLVSTKVSYALAAFSIIALPWLLLDLLHQIFEKD